MTGPADPAISDRVATRIARDFAPEARAGVAARLAGLDLGPWKIASTADGRERIHTAVLVLAHGDPAAFDRAVALAERDWRDALVAAGLSGGDWRPALEA